MSVVWFSVLKKTSPCPSSTQTNTEIQINWVDNQLTSSHPAHSLRELQSPQKLPPSSEVELEYQGKH